MYKETQRIWLSRLRVAMSRSTLRVPTATVRSHAFWRRFIVCFGPEESSSLQTLPHDEEAPWNVCRLN